MKVSISGASGFIGSRLTKAFWGQGWEVLPLSRTDLAAGQDVLMKKLEGSDVVINLAGAPIVKRWTAEYKKEIYQSRVENTRMIVQTLRNLTIKPGLFISISATGIYPSGHQYDESFTDFPDSFLASVCRDWEKEAMAASEFARVVIFRLGLVLDADSGALSMMLPVFRLGLGGALGSGKQAFSWVHIDDIIKAFFFVINDDQHEGIFNLSSPFPVSNKEYSIELGQVLKRPVLFRVPGLALRLLYGDGATTLLEGQSVFPTRLLKAGFIFSFQEIKGALQDLLLPKKSSC